MELYLEEASTVVNEGLKHHRKGNTRRPCASDQSLEPFYVVNKGKTMGALPAICVVWLCQQGKLYVCYVNDL